jgi:hypothetical protein
MLNIVEPVIKLCWVRYICYAGTYFCDLNDHVYCNVNGYGYPMGTRYPWWVWVWRNFALMIGSGYGYESIFPSGYEYGFVCPLGTLPTAIPSWELVGSQGVVAGCRLAAARRPQLLRCRRPSAISDG